MAKLSEIFDLQMGKTPARANPGYWNGGINSWISIADLSNCEKYVGETKEQITDIAIQESGIKKVPPNTVIMSFKLSLGKTAITKEATYTNEAIMAFIPKGNYEVSPDYFFYMLSGRDWSKGTNRAVMGVTLNKATLGEIDVIIPPFDKQCQVAAVLDKVGDLISLRKQQLAKLDEAVKSRFIEMFGESRINPKGWEIIQLEKIAEVGSSKRVFVEELQEQGVPFYRGTEIGALAEDKNVIPELFITEEHYQSLCEATGTPAVGDLLMPSICPDGRIWLVDNDKPFYFKDGRVLWIHPTNRQIDSCYLLYVLKEKIMTDYESIASGTTFVELKIFALKALAIMLPPIEQQQQFSAFIAVIKKQRLTIQKSLDKLETLKNSLMQQYFG